MRIGELAEQVGVSTDTVRFYERAGLLPRPPRLDNGYREYRPADVDHLRLLIDLRRMEIPLDAAARIAGWCHAGHCAETSQELPRLIAERRAEIADRVARLRHLDERLAELERHVARPRRSLTVLAGSGPCCEAAEAVIETGEAATCACCAGSIPSSVLAQAGDGQGWRAAAKRPDR